jgi:peptide/nickel transport system permease protein
MARYVIKRILLIIPVILFVSLIVYALVDLAPGDIVDMMNLENMTIEEVAELRHEYGLDKPLLYRWAGYMIRLIQGDLGISQSSGYSVWELYIYRLPNTLRLSLSALFFGTFCAIPLGIFAARHAGSLVDNAVTFSVALGVCIPSFWLALILLRIFSLNLGWFPAGGMNEGIKSMVLPVICSSLMLMVFATRQTRSSMLEVLRADYLRTARAKGVPENVVISKHALSNALIPIITVIGNSLSASLAGSVIIENVFSWPGVGRLAVEGVTARDTNLVLGTVIMTSIFYVLIQIFVDIAYAFADPRIKSQYVRPKRKKAAAEA